MRLALRRTAALGAALALSVPLAASPVSDAPASAEPAPDGAAPAITGYALPSLRSAVLRRDAGSLSTVTVVGTSLRADGRRVTRPGREPLRLLAVAEEQGLRTELLLSGWSNRLEAFDPRAADRLLTSEPNIRRVARRLASYVVGQGWGGVNIDLERLRRRHGPGLVLLAEELQRAMPGDRTVSVDISARTSLRSYRRAGYRLAALADAVDVVQLMAYDEHGSTWTGPGPVGSLPWQRAAVDTALRRVPADRLDLGVAGYGYTWPRRGVGRSVTAPGARRMVREDGATAQWRARAGEWRARLSDGTVVWWSDGRSLRLRHELARRRGLHGIALWRLGSADPLGPSLSG